MSDRCNEPCPVHRCPSRCLLISGHASLHRCSDADDRHVWRFPEKLRREIGATTRLRDAPWPSTLSSDQVDLLRWAASRPGVLSLLKALHAANYDETGTEHLARVLKEKEVPRREARPAPTEPWPFDDRSSYESMPYESMPIPIPIIDPEDPPRVTVEHLDAPARSWSVGPDDFPGEDYPPSVAIKLERAWEGRTCAIELCSEKATGEVYTWALGNIPICDKHR